MPPSPRQGRRALIGALLVLGLAAAAGLIFFLEDLQRAFARSHTIVGLFPEATGLSVGASVWIAGRPAGRVRSVEFVPDGPETRGRFAAELEFPVRYAPLIRRDSELRLATPRLLANPVVNLMPGTAGSPRLGPGDTLVARARTDPALLRAHGDTVLRALDAFRGSARALAAAAREREPAIDRVARELAAAGTALDALAHALEHGPLSRILEDTIWQTVFRRVDAITAEIDGLVAGRAEAESPVAAEAAAAVARLGRRAQALRLEILELREMLEDRRGFLGRAAIDPALRNAIARARAQADSLAAELRRRPWRLFF